MFLLFGIFIFISHASNHSVIKVINHIFNGFVNQSTVAPYTHAQIYGQAIGEIIAYAGALFVLISISGVVRRDRPLGTLFAFVALSASIAGLVVLFLASSVFKFAANAAVTVTIAAVQNVAVPTVVIFVLISLGVLKISHESTQAGLFCIGYSGVWILPSSFAVFNQLTGGDASQALAGGLICFATTLFLILVAHFAYLFYKDDLVSCTDFFACIQLHIIIIGSCDGDV